MDDTIDLRISTLSESEINALPFGVVRLDRRGTILSYNQFEADFAHRTARTTIGLNFFHDVAPCTAIREFEGRFHGFVASQRPRSDPFSFLFPFKWGRKRVSIIFVRHSGDIETVYVFVEIQPGIE
jgi:photoactive yellow protein